MSRFADRILQITRMIAGSSRADWIEAMAAEAHSIDGDPKWWALGCLWASVKDRVTRHWWFGAAVLLLPPCAIFWKTTVFFWTSSLLVDQRITPSIAVASWILSPCPVPFLFAAWRPGVRAYVVAAICFLAVELIPIITMWAKFGVSPVIWLGPNTNWYKADPGVRIGPVAGLILDLSVWLSAAWLGTTVRRRFAP